MLLTLIIGTLSWAMAASDPAAVKVAEERELARLHEADRNAEAAEKASPIVIATRPTPLIEGQLTPLHDTAPIWLVTEPSETAKAKRLVVVGEVVLREGMLELFACRRRSKEHESIVAIDVTPHLIHAGLLAIGADAGRPASFDPVFQPPQGDEIAIEVCWKDSDGTRRTADARDWIVRRRVDFKRPEATATTKPMGVPWVFAGSLTYTDDDGKNHYVADETGEIIGVSNFAGAILDVPLESSSVNESLLFVPNTEKIPQLGTEVTLIFSLISAKTEPPSAASAKRQE